ncbi:UPF0280 family protein [Breoghania sp.]|uniref:UPF0280 family protein n=1 Tax=Breoghania sp. TaxID=2065378 RepID=UPI002AA6652A|nr:UPF0280 family protein [Breoghania sp.]
MTAPVPFSRPTAQLIGQRRRLHLQHGPIDLVIEAEGSGTEVGLAYDQARAAFETVLTDLVAELPLLRRMTDGKPQGTVARRMHAATAPYRPEYITPMAAVAGSVADHVLAHLVEGRELARAYVNNGGDIALMLNEGTFRIRICEDPVTAKPGGIVELRPEHDIRGIATSGWRGRSHSLGIADAVTVLASSAAHADAAATMIANKVDLPGSPLIERSRASDLAPDSDLGDRLVTTAVGALSPDDIERALERGERAAAAYHSRGLLTASYIGLASQQKIVDRQAVLAPTAPSHTPIVPYKTERYREEPVCA